MRARGADADDEGSVLLLTLGYALLALVLVLVCVDATSLYLTQKRADAAADAAALAGADGSWVAIDDHAAGRQVGRHVRRLGHRDVALVVEQVMPIHDADPIEQSLADYRVKLDDYRHQGLYDLWVRVDGLISGLGDQLDLRVVSAGLNSRRSGRLAAELLLDQLARPTAIVCVSDVLAFGVLDATHDRGLVPGRDVTVIGFDDLPEAERQGLTTIHQPIHDKGRLVGELLLDPAQGPRQVTLPHTLMVRATSAPPRSN